MFSLYNEKLNSIVNCNHSQLLSLEKPINYSVNTDYGQLYESGSTGESLVARSLASDKDNLGFFEGKTRLIIDDSDYSNRFTYNGNYKYKPRRSKSKLDPFSSECKIPLYTTSNCFDSKTNVRKRNERERVRVKNVNEGFDRLRQKLPLTASQQEKRLSKVETLRLAITYINDLEKLLQS